MTVNLTATAALYSLGIVLPTLFHMIGADPTFSPMYIHVLLCGLIFGWPYGAVCGLIVPLFSSVQTGMPPIFPAAAAMVLELCAYGALTGLFFKIFVGMFILPAFA